MDMVVFLRGLPKAELHLHLEGTLEPEHLIELAERNSVELPFGSAEEIRKAFEFTDLQSFLDIYYQAASVLLTERDFYDLTWRYLQRASVAGVRHAEIAFDPQTHTARGVRFDDVIRGIRGALVEGERELGITSRLILSFLRHLSASEAMEILEQALPYKQWITAVGLDSTEVDHPPEKFEQVFAAARQEGWRAVAHAGEEGPPDYVWKSLDLLGAERIDHGVRSDEDAALVARLAGDRIPLTMCPLSNVKLGLFDQLSDHNLRRLAEAGVVVTLNSDDPAFFGGYVDDNFLATQSALGLDAAAMTAFSRNSFLASFLEAPQRDALLAEVDAYVAGFRS